MFFFFFSSRRRHTRSDRDWSSDVCSSDLVGLVTFLVRARRCSVRDYLALEWPPARSVLLSVAGMVVLLVAMDMASFLSGRPLAPPFVVGLYRTAWLPGLAFA